MPAPDPGPMLPWLFLALCVVVFGLGVVLLGRNFLREARTANRPLAWLALLPLPILALVALFTVRPYLGPDLVGAGDSYHYALQAADFITQVRQGVMPVFVGQSDYAFNGNVHTLRTAPYFTHLSGLLDLLTFRRLSFVTVQNLTVVVTSLLAAWAAYFCSLEASGGRKIAATLLAALYVCSPALVGPLVLQDMFATYMAVPWLILCWHGLAGILQSPDDRRSQLLAAVALGMTWFAHPPAAGWLSLAWGVVQTLRLCLAGGQEAQWGRQLAAGLLLAALSCYVFASVAPLGSRSLPPVDYHGYIADWATFGEAIRGEFTSFLATPEKATVRLGGVYLLLLLLVGCLLVGRRQWGGVVLVLIIGLFLPCLLPVPGVSKFLWGSIPERLVTLSVWPAQRLAPLLSAGIVVATAWSLRQLDSRRINYGITCALLLGAVAWSIAETRAIQGRTGYAKLPPSVHEPLFSREDLRLTRYSYDLFERTPGYFSHGWMDPEYESRLFDAALEPQDNATAIQAAAGPGDLIPIAGQLVRDLDGPGDFLLVFGFADPGLTGEITVHAEGIQRAFTLPQSGGPLAFGAGPHNAKTIPLRLTRPGTNSVTIASTSSGVSLRVLPVQRETLPVRVNGQTPYAATVNSSGPGFLETPRVFIAGYAATVNGRDVPLRRSTNNLVMVPVPPGKSEVVVTHPGPLSLRLAWYLSLGTFAVWPWFFLSCRREPSPSPDASWDWVRGRHLAAGLARQWRGHRTRLLGGLGALVLLMATALAGSQLWREHRAYGSMRIELEFPKHVTRRSEPILTLGRPGAADCFYIIHEDIHHIRVGVDHWGVGGPISEPIPLDFAQRHILEITHGGLYPSSRWFHRPPPPGLDETGRALLRVTLNGRVIFDQPTPFHRATSSEVALGRNPAGSSVAGDSFSGSIISTKRYLPNAAGLQPMPPPQ